MPPSRSLRVSSRRPEREYSVYLPTGRAGHLRPHRCTLAALVWSSSLSASTLGILGGRSGLAAWMHPVVPGLDPHRGVLAASAWSSSSAASRVTSRVFWGEYLTWPPPVVLDTRPSPVHWLRPICFLLSAQRE